LSERHEARIAEGKPWTMDKLSDLRRIGLLKAIVGFELEVQAWRETFKLSQNKDAEAIAALADGMEANGSVAIAHMMRSLGT